MKRSSFPTAALAALLLIAGACRSGGSRVASLEDEIEAAGLALEQRFRTGDVLGVADLYADDAILIAADGRRVEGRDEIDAYWSEFAEPLAWTREIDEIGGSDELAWERGTATLVEEQSGTPETSIADYIVLWRRTNEGEWRILLDVSWPPDPTR
jgi:uncharacterized protein (TIGR02246 family)